MKNHHYVIIAFQLATAGAVLEVVSLLSSGMNQTLAMGGSWMCIVAGFGFALKAAHNSIRSSQPKPGVGQ